ncbi:ataxin-7-like protein 2 [Neopsephotus bourkii]|uniref:ataxin-7-like protein 2 n=1 Tax=Neopsephotus bourkii TaxID=309878 RepID=UPI002AA5299C|nr:ataxin-7-like protein 2 [Neopsephotus bourkii]
MAAAERRVPGLDEFAGQSWSAWVQRAGPPGDHGSGLELEESGKTISKKLDAMTLIKEDMSIFGHCPAHDEFYLVVCNHCSQVVKPQAFQKHCERRHGPLSKLYARATKCHIPVNGTPGTAKALREKHPGARRRPQPLPERPDKDNNLCLFVPVVNLEKIPSIPKADGHGIKVPPKAIPNGSKESLGKPGSAAVPKEPPVPVGLGGDSSVPDDGPGGKPENGPAPGEKPPNPPPGATRTPPRSHKKLARKECDLNRQCGVLNPDTNKLCTRLLTCKIHSVHQRREVQGRDKDFDVLVAELKASSRRGDPPKDRSPPTKEQPPPTPQDPPSLPQPLTGPPSAVPCRAKLPHCPLPRTRLSSDSDPEDVPPPRDGGIGVFPLPVPKGGTRVSSEDSEEEGGEEPPRPPLRPPRPQAFCTFGSRLVSPGCYVFNRRLDRFCAALGSMLERHLSSHMWRKIPPAADPPPAPPSSPPLLPIPTPVPPPRLPPTLLSPGGSPHAAAACSQPEGGGCSRSITSPLPANTPSPSFSQLPAGRAGNAAPARECRDPEPRKWKPPLSEGGGGPPYKRTCAGGDGTGMMGMMGMGMMMGTGGGELQSKAQSSAPPGKTKGAAPVLNGTARAKRLERAPPHPRCVAEEEVKKRKNAGTYCRGGRGRPETPPPPPHPGPGGSVRRKKVGTPPGFEEKRSGLKSKAH